MLIKIIVVICQLLIVAVVLRGRRKTVGSLIGICWLKTAYHGPQTYWYVHEQTPLCVGSMLRKLASEELT